MSLRTVVIRGRNFQDDIVRFTPTSDFETNAFIESQTDRDLTDEVKVYDTGIKVVLFPTSDISDIGIQKWALNWQNSVVNPEIFFREFNTDFEEILE